MSELRDYIEVFKYKQTLMALAVGVLSYLGALKIYNLPLSVTTFLEALAAILLMTSGATGVNMVLDADIDALMPRTASRPIPAGRLSKSEVLRVSLVLLMVGVLISFLINIYVVIAGLLGVFIFDVAYTFLLKRRTPWSVVLCSFGGGMPALGGWSAATGSYDSYSIMLMLLVSVWSLLHIWTAATYYLDDYRAANVPMLPAVYGEKRGVQASLTASFVVLVTAYATYALGMISLWTFLTSLLPLLIVQTLLASSLVRGDYREKSFKAWKVASMFPALYFLLLVLS
ncbi:MAG: protoheme IX farnesyltransferase [Thermofilum sp.]|jgi:protoheme IX farnesyltransferase|nr:protoheme IX farnesyltransferase [Thermofilum sp.]